MSEIKEKVNFRAESSTIRMGTPYENLFSPPEHVGTIAHPTFGMVNFGVSPNSYYAEIKQCRHFYRKDPFASTVINRMCEISITRIKNRRNGCSDEVMNYYAAVAEMIEPLLSLMALEYFIAGMAIVEYAKDKIMGTRLNPNLGRTRYIYPKNFWIRNPEQIELKRIPLSIDRAIYLKIPDEDLHFIRNNGQYQDGTKDEALYKKIVEQFPDYVAAIKAGKTKIPLTNAKPIYRKLMPTQDYPQPFLVAALAALKHKQQIKKVDYSIANKALDAIRLVKVGNDEFPLQEGDDDILLSLKEQMNRKESPESDRIYTLYTNHTVTVEWVYPPLEALLNENKYNEPNADILTSFGFSKLLMTGASDKSNSGQTNNASVGPVATLNELRTVIIRWIKSIYVDLANENGFTRIPEPSFSSISAGDLAALASFAIEAVKIKAISKDTAARLIGSSYEEEREQIVVENEHNIEDMKEMEKAFPTPEPVAGKPTAKPGMPGAKNPSKKPTPPQKAELEELTDDNDTSNNGTD